jgi:hypothetical protein
MAGWLNVNRISQSFLSKGIVILSLTAFVLANVPSVMSLLGNSGWKLPTLFIGSLLFLIGYVIASTTAPPELSGRSVATHVIAEMLTLDTWLFFEGRRLMLTNLVAAFNSHEPFDLPSGFIKFAENALADATKGPADSATFKSYSPNIYHADIQLRQFVNPLARYSALCLLTLGLALMLIPTSINVVLTIWNLL